MNSENVYLYFNILFKFFTFVETTYSIKFTHGYTHIFNHIFNYISKYSFNIL